MSSVACVIIQALYKLDESHFAVACFSKIPLSEGLTPFTFLNSIAISLGFLYLSFSPSCHQLLLIPLTLPVCCTCSLYLTPWILALPMCHVMLTVSSTSNQKKIVAKLHAAKTYFPQSACLLTYIYTYFLF